jgi:hypothetical protein|tara:strand:- start:11896 stop:12927 length:1032 start_codon:yes stop_codon:yes gene_type:complete
MSFYSDNENFIKIKLLSEMKGLSDEEKLSKYVNIKVETRKRLKKAYSSSEDLCKFYEEAFAHVLFFEQEFLIINLFFEKECNSIFNYIKFGELSELQLDTVNLFSYKFINHMNNCFSEDEVSEFLKVELTELLSLEKSDWDSLILNRNSIVKKYALWLIESNRTKINSKVNIFSYLLFCKIWNYFESYNEHFDSKAIVFYNSLNEKFTELLNKEVYVNLNQIVVEIQIGMQGLLFKDLTYYPILDNHTQSSNGYILQRNKFNENVKLSEFLCKSYAKESIVTIFKMMIGKEVVFSDRLQKEINEKLNRNILPSEKELEEIVNLELEGRQNEIRYDFLKRLYIF